MKPKRTFQITQPFHLLPWWQRPWARFVWWCNPARREIQRQLDERGEEFVKELQQTLVNTGAAEWKNRDATTYTSHRGRFTFNHYP